MWKSSIFNLISQKNIKLKCIFFNRTNATDRWSCTGFTKTGLFRTEAIRFAVEHLRNTLPDVHGKKLGLLVIDSCGDKLRAAGVVYDIIRGNKKICDRKGNCFDRKSVAGFIGDNRSSVTQQVSCHMQPTMYVKHLPNV